MELLFEFQARACARLGSPLYAALLREAARDIRAGGPCAAALTGYEQAPVDDLVVLRLLGGVHALALAGRAPDLAAFYPSAGGTFDPDHPGAAWPAFRATVAAELDRLREWLRRPPQTNEVGRANLLLAGLLATMPDPPLPVRLFEIGASAGLTLRVDQFRYRDNGYAWGPVESPVVLAGTWQGWPPSWLVRAAAEHPVLTVLERHGCDLAPIDPGTAKGALVLRAYLWPDQTERAARLDGALALARQVPAEVVTASAAEYLAGLHLEPGRLTVAWHSITCQYLPDAERRTVDEELDRLAATSTPEAPFAHISFEPRVGEEHRFQLTVRLGTGPRRVLADAHPHGIPAVAR